MRLCREQLPVTLSESVAAPRVEFAGEELWGKYLDLSAHHAAWTNAPFGAPGVDYATYVKTATRLASVERRLKGSGAYRNYVRARALDARTPPGRRG